MGRMSELALEQTDAAQPGPFRGRRIITENLYPPIPIRVMDWVAYYEDEEPDDDGAMACGRGETEQAAIDELVDLHPREGEGECPDCARSGAFIRAHCASCEGTGIQPITETNS